MHITLGDLETGKPLKLDVDVMLRTRLLIQASSGSGKSWLLRRMAEQLFGTVPVIIIDPEGEFATLREKFGYVLVGQGGETPADVRSAGLVAHKLLELHASAVCDLYEMKPAARHEWVRTFLDALIDAPKKLWQRLVVIVDEAHLFAPEKGAGESVASDSMIALTTRGRKRGFGAVFATQRLGKLRKDAAAELLNVLIGQTFIDVDQERAVKALGVATKEARDFNTQLKLLPPGRFFALGTALSIDRVLVKVGPIETSHPKPGSSKHAAEPPPAPAKVKALLPQLGDLPKEAETKARTEAELRREVNELRRQLRETERAQPATPKAETKTVHKPILTDADRAMLVKVGSMLEQMAWRIGEKSESLYIDLKDRLTDVLWDAHREAEAIHRRARLDFAAVLEGKRFTSIIGKLAAVSPQTHNPTTTTRQAVERPSPHARRVAPALAPATSSRPARVVPPESSNGKVSRPQQELLNALAWLESVNVTPARRGQAALVARVSSASSGFEKNLSTLKTGGYIDYPSQGYVQLTEQGRSQAIPPDVPPSVPELHESLYTRVSRPQADLLRAVIRVYPDAIDRESLASAANVSANSSGFEKNVSTLRSLGLIDYPSQGLVKAQPVLFLEER